MSNPRSSCTLQAYLDAGAAAIVPEYESMVRPVDRVVPDMCDLGLTRIVRGIGEPPDSAACREVQGKRTNELTRTTATLLNNLAVGTFIAGMLSPWATSQAKPWIATSGLLVIAMS